jgi:hypothetical protein
LLTVARTNAARRSAAAWPNAASLLRQDKCTSRPPLVARCTPCRLPWCAKGRDGHRSGNCCMIVMHARELIDESRSSGTASAESAMLKTHSPRRGCMRCEHAHTHKHNRSVHDRACTERDAASARAAQWRLPTETRTRWRPQRPRPTPVRRVRISRCTCHRPHTSRDATIGAQRPPYQRQSQSQCPTRRPFHDGAA